MTVIALLSKMHYVGKFFTLISGNGGGGGQEDPVAFKDL